MALFTIYSLYITDNEQVVLTFQGGVGRETNEAFFSEESHHVFTLVGSLFIIEFLHVKVNK